MDYPGLGSDIQPHIARILETSVTDLRSAVLLVVATHDEQVQEMWKDGFQSELVGNYPFASLQPGFLRSDPEVKFIFEGMVEQSG